jgi:putative endonuclease
MQYPLKNWKHVLRGYKFGEKTFYSPRHLGADYTVPKGTPVFAPADCEIFLAGDFPEGGKTFHAKFSARGYGQIVMRCMHLQKMFPMGKYTAGDILGFTGNTGKLTTGQHLHIDLSRGSVKLKNFKNFIDPENFFSKMCARPASKSNLGNPYYLYILECADKTLYTGITTNLARRLAEHEKSRLGAKYTCARRPVKLVYSKKSRNRSLASKEEARIKKMNRSEKLKLFNKNKQILCQKKQTNGVSKK